MFRRFILALISLLMLSAIAATGDSNSPQKDPNPNRKIVTGPRAWALACSGVLNERNHDYHDSLATDNIDEKNIKKIKKLLNDSWGIKNKDDLAENLSWITKGGHREKFAYLGELLKIAGEVKYDEILKKFESEPQISLDMNQIKQRLAITKKYYDRLGEKSLIGWDYCRFIMLCRWGYMAGLITEDQAWEMIMPAARELQNVFDSWEDLGKNYLIGRQFWSYLETLENGELYNEAFTRMLEMRSSPWNIYPWKMDLTEGRNVENQKNN